MGAQHTFTFCYSTSKEALRLFEGLVEVGKKESAPATFYIDYGITVYEAMYPHCVALLSDEADATKIDDWLVRIRDKVDFGRADAYSGVARATEFNLLTRRVTSQQFWQGKRLPEETKVVV